MYVQMQTVSTAIAVQMQTVSTAIVVQMQTVSTAIAESFVFLLPNQFL